MAAPQQYPVLKNVSKDDILVASDSENYFATRQLSLGKLATYIHNWQGSTDLIDVTELRTDVDNLESALAALQAAVDALDVRVTNLEARVTTNEGDILTLQGDIVNVNTTLGQQSSFNTDTTNALAQARIDIDANTSATGANASITQNVMTSFGTFDSEGNLIQVSESFANSIISSSTGTDFATAQDLTNLEASVISYTDNQLTSYSTTSATNQLISTATADMATSSDLTTLESNLELYVDGQLTAYSDTTATQQLITTATSTKAEAADVTELQAQFTYNGNSIDGMAPSSALATAVNSTVATATAGLATASSVSSLTSTVNGNTASITTNQNTIAGVDGKLSASYALTVDAGGAIAGLKLLADGSTSAMEFAADQFKFKNGSGTLTPFSIDTVNNKIELTGDVVFSGGGGGGSYGDSDVQDYIDSVGEIFTSSTTISGGQITTGLIKNSTYANASGNGFSESGMAINLDAGSIHAKEFYVNSDGTSSFGGSHTAGSIGNWVISGANNLQDAASNPNIVLAPSNYSTNGEKVVISADSLALNAPVATFNGDMAGGNLIGRSSNTQSDWSTVGLVQTYTGMDDVELARQSTSVTTYSPLSENPNFKVSIPYGGNDSNVTLTFGSAGTALQLNGSNNFNTDNRVWADSYGKFSSGMNIDYGFTNGETVAGGTFKVYITPIVTGVQFGSPYALLLGRTEVYSKSITWGKGLLNNTYLTSNAALNYSDYQLPDWSDINPVSFQYEFTAQWDSGTIDIDLPNALPSSVITVGYEIEWVVEDIFINAPTSFQENNITGIGNSTFDFAGISINAPSHLGSTYDTTGIFDITAVSTAAFRGSDAQTLLGLNGMQLSGADGYIALGDVAASGYLAQFYGDVQIVGQALANSFVGLSDERLKENIYGIQDALEVVSELQPKIYTWNQEVNPKAPQGTHIGFIAQDVQEVLPVVVERIGDVGSVKEVDAVRYNDITALNTQAIKELLDIVEELKTEVKQLKQQINGKN